MATTKPNPNKPVSPDKGSVPGTTSPTTPVVPLPDANPSLPVAPSPAAPARLPVGAPEEVPGIYNDRAPLPDDPNVQTPKPAPGQPAV